MVEAEMLKILSAIAGALLLAGTIVVLPGMSPAVEASTPAPVNKADRLDYRPLGPNCSQQAWPYFENACMRDRSQNAGRAKAVRVVTTDRK
jgi:hypothetical protein